MESEEKKYLLLQSNYSVAYTEKNCFKNNFEYKENEEDTRSPKEIAESLKQKIYNDFLRKHYKNIAVLTATGTSLDNGEKSGKTRDGLWQCCKTEIDNILKGMQPCNLKLKEIINKKDIESLLSYIILYEKIKDDNSIMSLREELEHKIAEACNLELDKKAPHKDFLNKITARKHSDSRIQLFTTNYDTLFEQAANKAGFVIIDGFSFTQPREFAGKWFDLDIVNMEKTRIKQEESFVEKVFHLCKLHGSLNLTRCNKKNKIIQQDNPVNPLIIYPASDKYESSYEQPYFEMMSRFQQALRKEETLLIVIGFGFQDKHIQNVIIEAVEQNPSFQLLIVYFDNSGGINTKYIEPFFKNEETKEVKRGVNIIFDTFRDFTKNIPIIKPTLILKKEQMMKPFNHNYFLGYVNEITPQYIKIHFPTSSLLARFHHEGVAYTGGNVGNFIVVEGDEYGFLSRIIELNLPDSERKAINEKAIEHDESDFHPSGKAELLLIFNVFEPDKIQKTVSKYPSIGAKVYSCSDEQIRQYVEKFGRKENESDNVYASIGKLTSNDAELQCFIECFIWKALCCCWNNRWR
ncbi:hypothetical protein Barb4_00521 [Bacteroidales bacterium Barb4]|nr:hypothetical protein Barb4_00521 [Bacteroidales bacterium Barb4]